ncbi:MAG: carbohydrate ABC transporter permease [Ignavibacteriae bacterium HGW-Ignavibacteriae-1]|jgi:multiple sugar transport system permease protein|nr:MAG: carbohydrate ABC transporter permease [Ignavibacteriae bacterium HGW-Ignavibacteriae-1]
MNSYPIRKILLYGLLFLIAIGMIFPIFWMLLLSLKEYPEKYQTFQELLFSNFTLKNFVDALQSDSFDIYFLNSLFVATLVTAGNLLFCTLVAYAFARKEFIGKTVLFATLLGVMIIPPHVIMIPLYRMMVGYGWINSYYSLVLPWLVTPFGIFLMRQYIMTIPREIEDAARIDGAGFWYIIFRIIMPLSKPMLTVLAIYTFLSNWNSFLFPYLFTNTEKFRTLPVGLAFYLGKQSIDWGHLMAGAAISAFPIIVIFIIFQRQIIKGLTSGALKE